MSHRPTNDARLAANRQNAKKSTGPRTAAGKAWSSQNAFRHGAYSQPRLRVLEEFGEESEEYRELLAGTLESCPPANQLERELIEDIARLRWERRRLGRAKDAKVRTRLDALQLEWQRRAVEMEYEYSTAPPEQTLAFGLRRLPESGGKYRDLLALLDVLETQIAAGDFSAETGKLFQGLWGVQPTLRGVEILANFHRLAEQGGLKHVHPDAPRGADPAGASPPRSCAVETPRRGVSTAILDGEERTGCSNAGGTPGKNSAVTDRRYSAGEPDFACDRDRTGGFRKPETPALPEDEAARREEALAYRSLRLALMEERRDVLVERELFQKQRVPASRAAIDACLAPTDDGEWRLLMRWENSIDRQIERKIKLYLLLHGKATAITAKLAPPADGGGNGRGGNSPSPRKAAVLPAEAGVRPHSAAAGVRRRGSANPPLPAVPAVSQDGRVRLRDSDSPISIRSQIGDAAATAGGGHPRLDRGSPLQRGRDVTEESGGHRPPLQPGGAVPTVNCRLSTVDCSSKGSVFRNEAKNLLKTQGGSRNEAKRSQEMPRPRVHPPETKELWALNPRRLTVNCRLLTVFQPFALPAASG